MGWSFPWVSSANSDFNFDFGVSFRENQLVAGRSEHNFRPYQVDAAELPHGGTTDDPYDPGESPGVSAFVLDDGQEIGEAAVFPRYPRSAGGKA